MVLVVKNLSASARDIRDVGSIPGSGRSPGGGHGNPLQYSCVENSKDRRARQAAVHRVAELDTTEATEHTQLFSEKQNAARKVVKLRLVSRLCVF